MIGVVIPAHNEADFIGSCVASVQTSALCAALGGEVVKVWVVADNCSDNTAVIAEALGANTVTVNFGNVGMVRAAGADLALREGARWLAFTDADSLVAEDWLAAQLRQRAELVCGTVAVDDWRDYGEAMRTHYAQMYHDHNGHRHIHGANLGVCAQAYKKVGGFEPLTSSEDVALVNALMAGGATVAWSAEPRVVTSARRTFRAPSGFGATLMQMENSVVRSLEGEQ